MLDREASLQRARLAASLTDGVTWGMDEDAIEEAEVSVTIQYIGCFVVVVVVMKLPHILVLLKIQIPKLDSLCLRFETIIILSVYVVLDFQDDDDEITWQTYKGQLTEKQEKTREKVIKRMEKASGVLFYFFCFLQLFDVKHNNDFFSPWTWD